MVVRPGELRRTNTSLHYQFAAGEDAAADSNACSAQYEKSQKWTWAIPLEIIYLTPLAKWNPYNIRYCDSNVCAENSGDFANIRVGGFTVATAFNGSSRNSFYNTPEELWGTADDSTKDAADTAKGIVGMLDQQDVVRRVTASGHWIQFPPVKGFPNRIRQRYPIAPIHNAHDTTWMELKALQDVVLGGYASPSKTNFQRFEDLQGEFAGMEFDVEWATHPSVGAHTHKLELSGYDVSILNAEGKATVTSSYDNEHSHNIVVEKKEFFNGRGDRR